MSLVSADPPNARKIQRKDDVPVRKLRRDRFCRLELDPVPLSIVDRQRDDREAPLTRKSSADHRIETAGEEDDCRFHRRGI